MAPRERPPCERLLEDLLAALQTGNMSALAGLSNEAREYLEEVGDG